MNPLVLVALLAAPAGNPLRLASPGMKYVQVEEKVGDFVNEYFAQQLVLQGIRVTTKNEVAALIGFERQKELLGCSEESASCLGEMAGALGVDGLITGSLAQFGSGYAINLKIVSAKNGQTLAAYATRVKGEDALLDWLSETAKAFVRNHGVQPAGTDAPTKAAAGLEPVANPEGMTTAQGNPAPVEVKSNEVGRTWIYPAIAGGALLLVGGGGLVMTSQAAGELRTNENLRPDQVQTLATEGALLQKVGFAGLGAGALAVGIAGALFALGGSDAPPVSVVIRPGAAAVVFSGGLP